MIIIDLHSAVRS